MLILPKICKASADSNTSLLQRFMDLHRHTTEQSPQLAFARIVSFTLSSDDAVENYRLIGRTSTSSTEDVTYRQQILTGPLVWSLVPVLDILDQLLGTLLAIGTVLLFRTNHCLLIGLERNK